MTVNGARILVGIDGSETARHALEWALEEARLRKLPVEVVHAWQMVYAVEPMAGAGAMQFSPQELAADAQATLDEVVDSAVRPDGDVEIVRSVVEGSPGRSLVERADGAVMIVVGRHGHHPILAKLLGSVAEYVVHHSSCPVAVIPA